MTGKGGKAVEGRDLSGGGLRAWMSDWGWINNTKDDWKIYGDTYLFYGFLSFWKLQPTNTIYSHLMAHLRARTWLHWSYKLESSSWSFFLLLPTVLKVFPLYFVLLSKSTILYLVTVSLEKKTYKSPLSQNSFWLCSP